MPTHASTAPSAEPFSFKVLTVNIHKGFSPLNRTFMLHDLREAVRKHLEASHYTARWTPAEQEEGGDGVTIVWLR